MKDMEETKTVKEGESKKKKKRRRERDEEEEGTQKLLKTGEEIKE
jgi:hypothetical protein